MNDLNGLDWSQSAKKTINNPAALPPYRQTPTPQLSGRSTPHAAFASQQPLPISSPAASQPLKLPSKPATPANDSFASLVSTKSSKLPVNILSLRERQQLLQNEKLKEETERRQQYDATFGGADSGHWDTLGSGRNTSVPASFAALQPVTDVPGGQSLSKTINKPFASLDISSKRPVHSTALQQPSVNSAALFDDDDTFGLKQIAQNQTQQAQQTSELQVNVGDNDILGLLGDPVSDFKKDEAAKRRVQKEESSTGRGTSPGPQSAHDKAVAELVDMGFPTESSAIALATTESGLDVQAAVGWLLNQAHADAKKKTQNKSQQDSDELDDRPHRGTTRRFDERATSKEAPKRGATPAWMRDNEARSRSGQRRAEGQSHDKDVTQMASDIGSSILKSANSFWKTGRKQVQKAVADFQQDGDPNVPKWMRHVDAAESSPRSSRNQQSAQETTNEAMMLEGAGRPSKASRDHMRQEIEPFSARKKAHDEDGRDSHPDRMASRSPVQRQQTSSQEYRTASRLTRQGLQEKSSQAYVSPARRKKTTPQPQVDLFSPEPTPPPNASQHSKPTESKNPFLQATPMPKARPAATSLPPRPKAPLRQIPPISPLALKSSASDRKKGSEAFKRGDYSAAHAAYSSALGPLPRAHPVTIIVLCNRAVTNIKVGDPKAAIADTDAALAIIGASRGEDETIATGGMEGDKDMKEFYGKALLRKAEALENMEKWAEALVVWKQAVESGVGGAKSISGRNRCEKAAGSNKGTGAPAVAKRPVPARKSPPKPSALPALSGSSAADSEAVKRMKAANAAAERADDEKFALTDQVDAKLVAWRGTKSDNLRALLGSLDKVLWEDAGWKKVNMGDLVMANKVKIVYMKAIAKVHPDKISQTATTEQRMISAAVFATLNEAWDKFKTDNNL